MSDNEIILFRSRDGEAEVHLRVDGKTVWLTQLEIAELFATTVPNINIHVRKILEENELDSEATIKQDLIVRSEGNRQVKRSVKLYSLPMILAIGYRVRSPRGTEFRQWATRHLNEYLVKGFVMNDERLKNPGGWDYFDELLERIREIRASEKRFYQKVRDLFTLSVDYRDRERETHLFFAEVQNKLLYATTQHTAAEIIVARASPDAPNMALTSWSGSRVRKHDVIVAKNYLSHDEVDTLNRLVVIFLEQAELRVKERKQLSLDYWQGNVNKLLEFNDRPVLQGAGSISHDDMKTIAQERYADFDAQRKRAEALAADAEDVKELERVEKELKKKGSLS